MDCDCHICDLLLVFKTKRTFFFAQYHRKEFAFILTSSPFMKTKRKKTQVQKGLCGRRERSHLITRSHGNFCMLDLVQFPFYATRILFQWIKMTRKKKDTWRCGERSTP